MLGSLLRASSDPRLWRSLAPVALAACACSGSFVLSSDDDRRFTPSSSPIEFVNDGLDTNLEDLECELRKHERSEPSARESRIVKDPPLVFAGSSNTELAAEIASCMGIDLSLLESSTFADGERSVKINTNIRGKDVFIIQSTSPPVNEHLMELLLTISAMRRSSANSITAVVPYYGYKRNVGSVGTTKRVRPHGLGVVDSETTQLVSAADVAVMLETLGVDQLISVELQPPGLGQIEGFFGTSVRVDNLRSTPIAVQHLSHHRLLEKPVVVAGTVGAVELAQDIRTGLEKRGKKFIPFAALVTTQRKQSGKRSLNLVGDVKGRDCIIVDDLIDTASSLIKSVELLKANGARRIVVFATHGIFSMDAIQDISSCDGLDEVIITNTCPLSKEDALSPKIAQLSVAPVLATSIVRMHNKESLQDLRVYDRDNVRERYAGQGSN